MVKIDEKVKQLLTWILTHKESTLDLNSKPYRKDLAAFLVDMKVLDNLMIAESHRSLSLHQEQLQALFSNFQQLVKSIEISIFTTHIQTINLEQIEFFTKIRVNYYP